MASPRQVDPVPEITLIGGQADVPGYFYFGDLGTLDAYLQTPTIDTFRGVDLDAANAPPPPPPPPQLDPAPQLVPVVPPAPPANDPVAARPRQVDPVPEIELTAPRVNAATKTIATSGAASAAAAIFTEVLLPYVYQRFGINYVPFLGIKPEASSSPARRPGGDASGRRAAVPRAGGSSPAPALDPVLLTGRRPQPSAGVAPRALLSPSSPAAILYAANPSYAARGLEQLLPRARPATQPRARPRVAQRPSINIDTLAAVRRQFLGQPIGPTYNLGPLLPVLPQGIVPNIQTPMPSPAPSPAPRPYVPPTIRPELLAQPGTVPQPQPVPKEALDRCKCEKPKEREPRPPRQVCYSGTYRQLSKGIVYKRGKQIPCAPSGAGTRSSSGLDTLRSAARTLLPSFTPF